MKHIFKKLHLGGGHDPGRSSDHSAMASSSPSSSPSSSSLSFPAAAAASPSSSPSGGGIDHQHHHDGAPSLPATGEGGGGGAGRADYLQSEEEFQIELALAISASANSEIGDGRGEDDEQIRAATLMSLGEGRVDPAGGAEEGGAEALSRQYWDYSVLDYNVKVIDGFYDIFGLSLDHVGQKMPSLVDLQTNIGDLGFEVIVVNRAIDPTLVELEQISQCIALDSPAAEVVLLVQRISELVSENMGGPVRDANDMLARWMERSSELRTSLQTSLLPIGGIRIGLSRHRALLFKVLADHVGISCKLVKGSHYTGVDDDAIDMIKLGDREFLVDLMAAPGTLIPADVLHAKDASLNFNNARTSRKQNQAADVSGLALPKAKPYLGDYTMIGKSIPGNNGFVGMSRAEKGVAAPCPSASSEELPSSSATSSTGEILTPAEMLHQFVPSTGMGVSKQDSEVTLVNDGLKEKFSSPLQSQDIVDSRSLFAELNPFLVTGVGKASSLLDKPIETKKNEPQRSRDNMVSGPGRQLLPLVWKNRFACNEFSNNKQHDDVEGLFPRKNTEVKDLNASTSSCFSSDSPKDTFSELSKHKFVGISSVSYSGEKCAVGKEVYGLSKDEKDLSTNKTHTSSSNNGCGEDKELMKIQHSEKQHQGKDRSQASILRSSLVYGPNNGKNSSEKQDRRKCTYDRFMDTNMVLKDLGSSSILEQAKTQELDPMLDDVAECEIPWEDLVIGERIGLGSYGEVYRADWNGKEVAVKKFLDQDFSGDALDEFRREVRIMRRLRHPSVVLYMGAVTRPPNLSIVTEFLPRGSLYRILHRSNSQIDENRRIKMALDVAMGMNCLHTSTPTIVHRDLKSPNLLVDINWNVKVCDFGLSRLKHNTFLSSKSTAGTPEWMAPEVLRNEPSNEKCDVYSFGVILWELATLKMPWRGMNPMQVVGAVGFQNRRLDIPEEVDPLVASIIWQCWQTDPSLRPSFAQLTASLILLQQLVVPSHDGSESPPVPQEIPVNSNPQSTQIVNKRN